jgi:hypothetical protein
MRNYLGDELFPYDSRDICKNLRGNILIMRQDGDNHDTKKLNRVVGALRPSIKWYLNQVKYLSGGKLAEPYLK